MRGDSIRLQDVLELEDNSQPRTGQQRVGVVLVSFHSSESTLRCLASVLDSDYKDILVYVVDNGHDSDLEEGITRLGSSRVRLIPTGRNLGFPAGCNIGLKESLREGAEYVLLLNNDAILAKNGVTALVSFMRKNPAIGILGPSILNARDPGRIESMGAWYIPWLGEDGLLERGTAIEHTRHLAMRVDYVSGAAMLIRRKTIETIGLLREQLFIYGDDVDYCARARHAKIRVVSIRLPIVVHQMSSSVERYGGLKQYYLFRNKILLPYVLRGWCALLSASLYHLLFSPVRMLNYLRLGRPDAARGHALGILDAMGLNLGPSRRSEYRPE